MITYNNNNNISLIVKIKTRIVIMTEHNRTAYNIV